jgi:flotillin
LAAVGESEAQRNKEIALAQNTAESVKGQKAAEADQRVFVQQREAEAIGGENTSQATIANSNALLAVAQAEARQRAEVAARQAEAQIQIAQARAENERLVASEVVRQEVERRKAEILAGADAEQARLRARGEADAIRARYEAEAEGLRKVLQSKAEGYRALVESCAGDARAVASLLMIEKIESLVEAQVAAIKNLKIDKITVWDSAGGSDKSASSTAGFLRGMIGALPPIHELAKQAGIELPAALGKVENADETEEQSGRSATEAGTKQQRPS